MAVKRQQNWLNQQRVDVPHIRALESAVAADFDVLAGRAMAGDVPLVVRGLTVAGIAELAAAKTLSVVVADSLVINLNADEAGSFLWTENDREPEVLDPDTNAAVEGGWTPSTTNYVGMAFLREADAGTTDLVQFLASNTGLEVPRQVPLAKTLDYRLVISTLPFSSQSNLVPIARVTLNADSKVTAIRDSRPLMFRLGSGGDNPDPGAVFGGWTRNEVLNSITTTEFQGGDKSMRSLKDWQDAIMTRLWEIGGGEFWYSSTADRNVRLVTHDDPGVSGEYFIWDSGTEELEWQNLRILFDNSTAHMNDIEDGLMTGFAPGYCLYVDIDRAQYYAPAWLAATVYAKGDIVINDSGKTYVADVGGTSAGSGGPTGIALAITDNTVTWRYIGVGTAGGLVPQKTHLTSLGIGAKPGSRYVLAWRQGDEVFTRDWRYPLGTLFQPATASTTGTVKLSRTASTPAAPIVISDTGGTIAATGNDVGLTITAAGSGVGLAVTGGTSHGATFTAGGTNANGLIGTSSSGSGAGVRGNSGGTGPGVFGSGGSGTAYGVQGFGGTTGGAGAHFEALAGNTVGAEAFGFGTGAGLSGTGGLGLGAPGGTFSGGGHASGGPGLTATGTGIYPSINAVLASDTSAALLVATGPTGHRRLISYFNSGSGGIYVRTYSDKGTGSLTSPGHLITINLAWNGTSWDSDDAAATGSYIYISTAGIKHGKVAAGANRSEATFAAGLDTANTKIAVSGGIGFQNSWADNGSGYTTTKYWKDAEGVVHIEGAISGGTANLAAFTLPVGYRPSVKRGFTAWRTAASAASIVLVDSTGEVIPTATETGALQLDGITFMP